MGTQQNFLQFDAALPQTARRVFLAIQDRAASLPCDRTKLAQDLSVELALLPRVTSAAITRLHQQRFIHIEETNVTLIGGSPTTS